jgi:hypothetical protein
MDLDEQQALAKEELIALDVAETEVRSADGEIEKGKEGFGHDNQ